MKRFLIIALVVTSSVSASAQARWSALTVGLSNPRGAFYQNNLTKKFNEAVGAKPGWYASYEGAYYIVEGSKINFGASYIVSFAKNDVNWSKWVSGSTSFSSEPFGSVEVKLGFITTYLLSDNLQIDAFARLGDNFFFGGAGRWSASGSFNTASFNNEGLGVGYGTNIGLNVRFTRLIGTFQYKMGKVERDFYFSGSSTSQNYSNVKIPITSIHLGIGVLITKR